MKATILRRLLRLVLPWAWLGLAPGLAWAQVCVTDAFAAGTLDSSVWNVNGNTYTPQVVNVGSSSAPNHRLRLTDNVGNRATMTQLRRWIPAAANRLTVTFDYYGYGGGGADGVGLVLSDASVPPSPGAPGGSLGYAQNSSSAGFNGGWLGIGLDEYGNFPNVNEGRKGYPGAWTAPSGARVAAGFHSDSMAVRGSGSGTTGYALLANTGDLGTLKTSSTTPYRFRITVDSTTGTGVWVMVQVASGGNWNTLVPSFNVMASGSGQTGIPTNFLLSFAASTGGVTNYHEIDNVEVCATKMLPVGGSSNPTSFECLETSALSSWSSTARKPLHTRLAGTAFKFDVVALKADGSVEDNMVAAGGSPKSVTVELFDATGTAPASCAAYAGPVASQTLVWNSGDTGRKTLTASFNLAKAWPSLRCRVTDTNSGSAVHGCSSDTFSVRPPAFTSVASADATADATGTSATATPTRIAGGNFSLSAGTGVAGYAGTPTLNGGLIDWLSAPTGGRSAPGTGTLSGSFTTAASATTGNGASGSNFSYSEVGYFRLLAGAVVDTSFVDASGDARNGDCTASTSNTLTGNRYGCWIGNTAASPHIGRFVPARLDVTAGDTTHRVAAACSPAATFTYLGEPFGLTLSLSARNLGGAVTQNYSGSYARLNLASTTAWNLAGVAGATPLRSSGTGARLTVGGASGSWASGQAGNVQLTATVARAASVEAPLTAQLGVAPVDSDGVTVAAPDLDTDVPADTPDHARVATLPLRHGRLRLVNTIGAAERPLEVPWSAQYWTGSGWADNTLDSCTTLPASAISLGNLRRSLVSTDARSVGTAFTLAAGQGRIRLAAPAAGHAGTLDIALSLGSGATDASCLQPWSPARSATTGTALAHLRGGWCGTTLDQDPAARISFGLARGSDHLLDQRENP